MIDNFSSTYFLYFLGTCDIVEVTSNNEFNKLIFELFKNVIQF